MASPSAPTRLPLVISPEQRGLSSDTDSRIVNAYLEKDKEGNDWVNKRPSYEVVTAFHGTNGNGIFRWKNDLYSIVDTNLYKNGAIIGAVTQGDVYWWNTTLGTPSYLYLSNGTNGYTVTDAGVFAAIVDATYTSLTTVPGSAYLDGTLYVMDAEANIYGTKNLNDPTVWDPLNFLKAQVEPDGGVALAKQLVYVIALKQWTTEVFYDAGNPTGSPLLPVQNAKQPFGCVDGDSVQNIDDKLFWLSSNRTGGFRVVMMDHLQCQVISTFAVDRYITSIYGPSNSIPQAGEMYSWSARINGHSLYAIAFYRTHVGGGPRLRPYSQTLVYDIEEKNWYFWTGLPFVAVAGSEGTTFFRSSVLQTYTGDQVIFDEDIFRGDIITGPSNPTPPNPYFVDIITPNWDGGVKLGKVLSRLKILADSNSAGTLWMRYNDHDYKPSEWSDWLQVNLQDPFPQWTDLGTFRRRAFHFQHRSPTPFRMRGAEVELLLCPV